MKVTKQTTARSNKLLAGPPSRSDDDYFKSVTNEEENGCLKASASVQFFPKSNTNGQKKCAGKLGYNVD